MNRNAQTEAGHLYEIAHKMHYADGELRKAFDIYRRIVAGFPNTKEAGYAESQLQVIVNAIVPKEDRLSMQMDLAAARFDAIERPDDESLSPGSSDSERSE